MANLSLWSVKSVRSGLKNSFLLLQAFFVLIFLFYVIIIFLFYNYCLNAVLNLAFFMWKYWTLIKRLSRIFKLFVFKLIDRPIDFYWLYIPTCLFLLKLIINIWHRRQTYFFSMLFLKHFRTRVKKSEIFSYVLRSLFFHSNRQIV